jgi:predicted dehydrogenase
VSHAPIGVGIIGANPDRGWASRAHVPAIKASPDFRLAAVATTRIESARAAQHAFGADHAYTDPAALAEDPAVELVIVSVKVAAHDALIGAALAAGKHVWCDWPLSRTAADAAVVAEAAESVGVHHVVGLQARSAPAVAEARRIVERGELGTILSATLYSSRAKGNTTEVPGWTAYTYDRDDRAGLVEVLGGHALDLLQHLLGPVRSLTTTTAIRSRQHTVAETGQTIEVTAADHLSVTAVLDSGALASIHLHDAESALPRTRLEIMGTAGDLALVSAPEANPWAAQLQISGLDLLRAHPGSPDWERVSLSGGDDQLPTDARNLSALYAQVASDLRTGTRTAPDFHTARRIHELLES